MPKRPPTPPPRITQSSRIVTTRCRSHPNWPASACCSEHATEFPAPDDPKAQKEARRDSHPFARQRLWKRGSDCPDGDAKPCLDITKIRAPVGHEPRSGGLKRAWIRLACHRRAHAAKRYARMVELSNAGSRELGYTDVGALWRSKYDMPPDDFARELDRVWEQLRPLYLSLHAYVRGQLAINTAGMSSRRTDPSPRIFSGNPGRRNGTTSTS